MPNNNSLRKCRVCGLAQPDYPWGEGGAEPVFSYCPCCGVEFGYGDCQPSAVRTWRAKWLANGAHWDEPDARPENWSLENQLREIPEEYR